MKKILMIIISLLIVIGLLILIFKTKIFNIREALRDQVDANSGETRDVVEYSSFVADTYDDILNYISSNDDHMLIIGRQGCHFCNLYKPIVEEVSNEYKFEYLYVDFLSLSKEDQQSLYMSEIKIPGKCRDDKKDAFLYEGFGTPITLFIHNKTSYDCIRGYVDKDTLVSTLKEISFIN